MKIKHIAHVAIYGKEMNQLKGIYQNLLGLQVSHQEVYEEEADLCFLPVGDAEIELVTPTRGGNNFDLEVDREGQGINHIAFEVEDIESAITELKGKGVLEPDAKSFAGGQGSRVIFLDPAKTGGVSIELVESA